MPINYCGYQDNINKIIVQTTNVVNESGNKLKQHISTVYKLVDVQTNEWVKSNILFA